MSHATRSEFVVLQSSLSFLDGEVAGAGEDPLVAFAGTDAAVTF
jgi:hypothetical protein